MTWLFCPAVRPHKLIKDLQSLKMDRLQQLWTPPNKGKGKTSAEATAICS